MRERLVVHLRGLPQIVESWNRSEDTDPQPSQFARSLTKVHKNVSFYVNIQPWVEENCPFFLTSCSPGDVKQYEGRSWHAVLIYFLIALYFI